jgi:hypothetical protein
MLVISVLVIAIACCPLGSADSVYWIFTSPGCSGSLIDWDTFACWSKVPAAHDDVTITPPLNIPPFSVVIRSAVQVRSLTIEQRATLVLEQALNVSESCQLCGNLNSTRRGVSLSCKSLKSCASIGASLFSGSADSSLAIRATDIQDLSVVAENLGKVFVESSTNCRRCSMLVARGGEFQAFGSILSASAYDCSIVNFGRLALGQAAPPAQSSADRYYDCSVSSSSEMIVESSAFITRPVHIMQVMKLHPSLTLSLTNTVVMQSLQISQTRAGQPATILFRSPSLAFISIDAVIASGVLASFDSCPETTTFLNISSIADIQWNCASSFFSIERPSFLKMFGQAQIRFGSTRSVQSNAVISADVSLSFISSSAADQQLKARWSNVFNMQNLAEALIASNILLDYASPCYKPASLSISLFESSSIVFQGSHVLLFGVSILMYGASQMNVTTQTSYLQSLHLRSTMIVHTGNIYVSIAFLAANDDDKNDKIIHCCCPCRCCRCFLLQLNSTRYPNISTLETFAVCT